MEGYPIYVWGSHFDITKWWITLSKAIKNKVFKVGFFTFVDSIPIVEKNRKILFALAERW